MSKLIIRIDARNAYSSLISLVLCSQTLVLYMVAFLNKLPIVNVFTPFIMPFIYTTLAILSLRKENTKWIRIGDLLLLLLIAIALLYTRYAYPVNWSYISKYMDSWILPCIPYFFLGLCFHADEECLDKISKFSCASIFAALLYAVYFQRSGRNFVSDNMSAAYAIMPNVMVAINYAFRKRKKIIGAIGLLGCIYIIALGTRGPVVIIASYILIEIWRYSKFDSKTIIALSCLLGIIIFVSVNSNIYFSILTFIGQTMTRFGLSNRITEYMRVSNLISDTSGRDLIYETLIEKLKERPWTGYGIFGEWQFVNYVAHNIYLEVLFNYGIIIGTVILTAYIGLFVKDLAKNENRLAQEWLILWGCAVFIRGIFGGSVFSVEVFFLLGFMLKTHREKRCSRKINHTDDLLIANKV